MRTLCITKVKKQWKVHWANEDTGTIYTLRSIAISAAKKMVAKLPPGECGQIKIQKQDGKYSVEWAYGVDPFPMDENKKDRAV